MNRFFISNQRIGYADIMLQAVVVDVAGEGVPMAMLKGCNTCGQQCSVGSKRRRISRTKKAMVHVFREPWLFYMCFRRKLLVFWQ